MNTQNYGPVNVRTCDNCGARHKVIGWDRDVTCLCGAIVSSRPEWLRREWPGRVGRFQKAAAR